ncbi:holin-like protein [Aequitasia blattaphilus]|uniref:CidA/LrgA family protein n=1 Tax=Aequitasia blattaphilus TaxID=2949332 RepID=A0ABT1E7F3_9FIRM|nr:CidA/LrgA family protein [Aequitasia blattaphilus]MCP1101544.1 CidA/LrgA family protein [Aequitasia blattaphilus]MCR8614184.1 CidA/LrgA family protein [Aequitasia blattaphilus]
MKIVKQLVIILSICVVSDGIAKALPFSFPGSVVALVLLAILLVSGLIKEKQIQETADFLLVNIGLVFIPWSVGVLYELKVLKGQLLVFFFVVILSLFLTFLSTYYTVYFVQKLIAKRKKEKKHGRSL